MASVTGSSWRTDGVPPGRPFAEEMRFEKLVLDIAADFVSADVGRRLNDSIDRAVSRLGKWLDVDRGMLCQIADESGCFNCTHWSYMRGCKEPNDVAGAADAEMPWTSRQLLGGQSVLVSCSNDLPADASTDSSTISRHGIKSMIAVPIGMEGRITGMLRFDDLQRERTWPADVERRLRLVGDIMVRASRRQLSEKLVVSQHRAAQHVLDSAVAQIMFFDKDGRLVQCNSAVERALGAHVEQLKGRTIDLIAPHWDDPGHRHEESLEVVRTGNPRIGSIESYQSGQSTAWVRVDKTAWRDSDGEIIGLLVFIDDITELVEAQEALRLTQFGVDSSKTAIFWLDADARFQYVNQAACESLGYTRDELLRLSVPDIDPEWPNDVWPERFTTIKNSGSVTFESTHRHKSGVEFPVEITVNYFSFNKQELIFGFVTDIRERKLAQQALVESEERYALAVAGSSDGLWDWDIASGELYWSPAVFNLLGFKPNEFQVTLEGTIALLHRDDRERVIAALRDHIENGRPYDEEMRLSTRSGTYRWYRWRGEAIRDPEGHATRMAGSISDIDDRKRAEDALRMIVEGTARSTGERFFRNLVQYVGSALEFCNVMVSELPDASSQRLRTIASWRSGSVGGNFDYDPADTPSEITLQRGRFVCRNDLQQEYSRLPAVVHRDARSYLGVSLIGSKGEILGVLEAYGRTPLAENSYAQSIITTFANRAAAEVERTAAERSLRQQEALLLRAQKIARMGSWEWDLRTNKTKGSEELFRIYGEPWTRESEFSLDLIHPDDQPKIMSCVEQLLTHGAAPNVEYRIIRRDGEERLAVTEAEVVKDAFGNPVKLFGIVLDITERRRVQDELRQKEQQLAHLARLSTMGEMVAGIAHEINQPLYAITNFAEASRNMLESSDGEQIQRVLQWTRAISTQAQRAGQIIHRLAKFASKAGSQVAVIDIVELVKESSSLILFDSQKRNIELRFDFTETSPTVYGDKLQIQQVLVNLMRNAVEVLGTCDRSERRVTISTSVKDELLEICVADNGPGFSPETSQRIFEPFFTTKPEGMGMGLAICRSIVESHGGKLNASRNAEGGASFRFSVPLVDGASG